MNSDIRTSASHPLYLAEIPAGMAGGMIGITLCPGKHDHASGGFVWRRDLDADLAVIAAWPAAALVTLIEDQEFPLLKVEGLGARAGALGMEWHHLPITDVKPPDHRFEALWKDHGPRLLDHLRQGRRVVVHCRGGLGRAGTVGARLLVELGVEPEDAIRQIRLARPGAIETRLQADYVRALTGKAS
jgi:ADP-ribosyl-[dinitrogen reductase] hydrolase